MPGPAGPVHLGADCTNSTDEPLDAAAVAISMVMIVVFLDPVATPIQP
jgi:hypothetical protein